MSYRRYPRMKSSADAVRIVTAHDYYVSAAGSDGAAGTAAAPLATLQEALKRISSADWLTYAHVTVVGAVSVGANQVITLPEPRFPAAERVLILGSWVDSGAGLITAGGGTAGASSGAAMAGGTITGISVAKSQRGSRIRWVTGSNAGATRWSSTGSTTVLTSHRVWPFAPLAGDTFVTEVPGSTLLYTGSLIFLGTGAFLNGLHFSSVSATNVVFSGDFIVNGVWFRPASGSVVFGGLVSLQGDILPAPAGVTVEPLGVFIDGAPVATLPSATVDARGSVFRSTNVRPEAGSQFTLRQTYATENFSVVARQSRVALDQLIVDAPTTNGNGITAVLQFERASDATISDVSIAGLTAAVDHVSLNDASRLAVTSWLTGTGGTGVGLRAMRGAEASVPGANSTCTIAGAAGAVKVGGNAIEATWAPIAAGLTANVSDQGAASTQRAWVGP